MRSQVLPLLDITEYWGRLNDTLIALVDYVPDDKLNWSPKPDLWNFKGIFLHVSMSRHSWMVSAVRDGEDTPDVLRAGQTREGIKDQLRLSWQRLLGFLSDPTKLSAEYSGAWEDERWPRSGHWIAFHLLEHDVHHRADILHYLALLGIEHPEVGTP